MDPLQESIQESANLSTAKRMITEQELAELAKKRQKTVLGSFFPILSFEWPSLILLSIMFMIIAFSYTFLRLFKDRVIYTVLEPSAQNWLKFFTFLAALFTVSVIQRLLANFNIDRTFEVMTLSFAGIMAGLGLLLNYRESFQLPDGWTQELFVNGIGSCRGVGFLYTLTLIWNHILLSVLYVVCEVIGSIMVSFLFMTYVNTHCTLDQNKRFVPLLYFWSNIASCSASQIYQWWNSKAAKYSAEECERYYLLFPVGTAAMFIVVVILKRVLDVVFARSPVMTSSGPKKSKKKMAISMMDAIYYALASKLLLALCTMSLLYNVSQTLLATLSTSSYAVAAPALGKSSSELGGEYKARDMKYMSVMVSILVLSPLTKLVDRFGVGSAGSVPLVICLAGALVSTFMAMNNYPACGNDNMAVASYFNDAKRHHLAEAELNLYTSAAVKISKYAFFDIVKEALAMKISPDERAFAKGVVDGVCGKLGKCVGAFYGIILEAITDVRDCRYYAPVTLAVFLLFVAAWAAAILYLHRRYAEVEKKDAYLSMDYFAGTKLK